MKTQAKPEGSKLVIHVLFIREWFIRKHSAGQKVKKVQYWIFET